MSSSNKDLAKTLHIRKKTEDLEKLMKDDVRIE